MQSCNPSIHSRVAILGWIDGITEYIDKMLQVRKKMYEIAYIVLNFKLKTI